MSAGKALTGMSEAQARTSEGLIIALCLLALFAIFQPFSLTLFSIGCGLVVLGGLAFNLVPFCEPGRPARDLWKAAGVIRWCSRWCWLWPWPRPGSTASISRPSAAEAGYAPSPARSSASSSFDTHQ